MNQEEARPEHKIIEVVEIMSGEHYDCAERSSSIPNGSYESATKRQEAIESAKAHFSSSAQMVEDMKRVKSDLRILMTERAFLRMRSFVVDVESFLMTSMGGRFKGKRNSSYSLLISTAGRCITHAVDEFKNKQIEDLGVLLPKSKPYIKALNDAKFEKLRGILRDSFGYAVETMDEVFSKTRALCNSIYKAKEAGNTPVHEPYTWKRVESVIDSVGEDKMVWKQVAARLKLNGVKLDNCHPEEYAGVMASTEVADEEVVEFKGTKIHI